MHYCIFSVPGKRKKKLKQTEIEVKIITKMKRNILCSNWQTVFIKLH